MADVTVVVSRAGLGELQVTRAKLNRNLVEAIADDARRRCPQDTGELGQSIHTTHRGATGRIWVGTDHWAPTEFGSGPHIIRVKSKKVLHNRETGDFFGKEVRHPGTPEQPFMRPAAYTKRRIGPGGVVT